MEAVEVRVRGLSKRFGDVTAVGGISFGAQPDQVTALVGPNGAGKTTTLHALVGLVHPSTGEVTYGGLPYLGLRHPQQVVGVVLDPDGFRPGRSARDHLRVLTATVGGRARDPDELLDLVGLGHVPHRLVRALSLGMRQRLAIASALVGDPAVLILDEPYNGLDPQGLRWLRGFVRRLADEGRTVLISTHRLDDVAAIADRVVLMDRGRVVLDTELTEVADRAGLEQRYFELTGDGGVRL